VITSGAGGEDIAWIAGYRADERFAVSTETERFLLIEVF